MATSKKSSSFITVELSAEFAAAAAMMRVIDQNLPAAIDKYTASFARPEWTSAASKRVRSRLQRRAVAETMKTHVSAATVTTSAGGTGGTLSGGMPISEAVFPAEFGSKKYKRFGPRSRTGKVFYPAAREMIPRVVQMYVQTTKKTIALSLEGKR
jgi:hypothetical protein